MNNNLEFENEDPSPNNIEDNHPRTNYGSGFSKEQSNLQPLQELLNEGYDPYDSSHHIQVQRMLQTIEEFVSNQPKKSLKELCKQDSELRNEVIDLIKEWRRISGENRILTKTTFDNWIEQSI